MFVSMKVIFKNKEFRYHDSGLWVAQDGEVYVPYVNRHPAHFTFGCVNGHGYIQVQYKHKIYLVHRLVAQCWINNPDNLPTVDHINRNPLDNRAENLRWANMIQQNRNRREHPKNNALSKKVYQYTLSGELVKVWPSTNECGRNGFDQGNVATCCRGKYKTYKGFIWSYNKKEVA